MPENRTRMPAFRTLHDAAANGNPAEVEALLPAGADPDAPGDNGVTPLHPAAAHNAAPAVVEALTGAGADPNAGSRYGATPLHMAARSNGNPAVVEALLAAGADPNVASKNGVTPLHPAVGTLESATGRSPDGFADPGVGALLDLATYAEQGWTPIYPGPRPPEPVRFVDTRVRLLLAAGAAPNARDRNGRTPLHRVVRHFDDPVPHARRAIAALLDGGAGTKARDDFGKMPFDYIKDGERWKETDLYRRLRS